jgi:hypothetical protein
MASSDGSSSRVIVGGCTGVHDPFVAIFVIGITMMGVIGFSVVHDDRWPKGVFYYLYELCGSRHVLDRVGDTDLIRID